MNSSTVDEPINVEFQVNDGANVAFTAVTGVCLVLVFLAGVAKYIEKRRSRASLDAEHWTLGSGLLLFIAFATAGICLFSFSDQGNSDTYSTSLVASNVLYAMALAVLKISLLLFYQKTLFHRARYWKISIALACFFSIYTFIEVLVFSLQCRPIVIGQIFQPGKCINIEGFEITVSIFDFLTGTAIFLMPCKRLWELRTDVGWTTTVCVGLAFFCGFFACILSLVHPIVSVTDIASWTLLYPLTGMLTLTLIVVASAIASLPTLILSRGVQPASPTAIHPYQDGRNSRASVFTWNASLPSQSPSVLGCDRGHEHTYSSSTFPSVTEVDEAAEGSAEKFADAEKERQVDPEPRRGGRSMSLTSYQRLGSLTGTIKTPSFLQNMSGRTKSGRPPSALELSSPPTGIHVQTDLEMTVRRKSGTSMNTGSSSRKNTPSMPGMAKIWSKGWS